MLDILMIVSDVAPLRRLLPDVGYRIFPVSHAEAALNMLEARRFDLIMVALQPVQAAVIVIDRIRTWPDAETAVVPVIALATTVDPDEIGSLLAAGADQALPPPVSRTAIAAALISCAPAPVPAPETGPDLTDLPVVSVHLRWLLVIYRDSLQTQLRTLESQPLTPDTWRDIAHRLKGSAGNFGLALPGFRGVVNRRPAAAIGLRCVRGTAIAPTLFG